MEALRDTSESTIKAIEKKAKEREVEIQAEAMKSAELAATERIAAIETAKRESEAALQAQLEAAESSRIQAELKEAELNLQVANMQEANVAEIAKIKQDAEAEGLRIRQAATEEAEARHRNEVAAHEASVAEAKAKVREVEAQAATLAQNHAVELEAKLSIQREALERANEETMNIEKAKSFEESQRLSNKVNELQRALDKKTNEELGEGAEVNIFEALKKEFPDDKITRIAKGAPGADVRHVVVLHGKECGTILYDSKNHIQFRYEHVTKLKADQLAARAEHAILSTHKFPQGTRQLHVRDGVLLANPARVVSVATIVRQHLMQLHTLRLSDIERESKTAALYEFITSERCLLLFERIDERAGELLEQQTKEIRWHENNWRRQGEAIRSIQKAKGDLANQISTIIGTSADSTAMSEAS
jgi:hypothetical protein